MKPNYIAKKSVAPCLSFWKVLSCIFIIPIFVYAGRMIAASKYRIEFYDDYVITKSGVFSTKEQKSAFAGVYSIGITQTVMGKIFNYGNVNVDMVGKCDLNTTAIKNPTKLKEYLETRLVKAQDVNKTVVD